MRRRRLAAAIDAARSWSSATARRCVPIAFVMALDDGVEPDERPPAALAERLAFRDRPVHAPSRADAEPEPIAASALEHDAALAARPPVHGGAIDAGLTLVATAAALGIDSARAPLFALRAARAAARLAGRDAIADEDVALAARLVLGAARDADAAPSAEEPQPDAPPPPPNATAATQERGEPGPLDDIVLAAALAALPKDVLARIAAGRGRSAGARAAARASGASRRARGRPMGARAGHAARRRCG